jgi:polyphosphate kinase
MENTPTKRESAPAPARREAKPPVKTYDLTSTDRFVNRELSWLAFNTRVLDESKNVRHPLLERLRFLSISAANLDEFYMVRVAGLKGMVNAGVATVSDDGRRPQQQLDALDANASDLMREQQRVWLELKDLLRAAGIAVVEPVELSEADRAW